MGCLGDSTVGDHTGPYLQEEILSLKDLNVTNVQDQESELAQSAAEPAAVAPQAPPPVEERKPAEKKLVKPKWLKM